MKEFTESEKKFLQSLEEARIATVHDNIPHVKPVSFIIDDDSILIATDYNTRTFKNIKENSRVALVVDVYQSGNHRAVCIQGKAEVIENGTEFKRIYKMFESKFAWVRNDPWGENEAPFLRIYPEVKISWGLK